MSLRWNVSEIADHESLCYITAEADSPVQGVKAGDRVLSPVTHALIWLTVGTGVGWGIREENVEEFIARVHLWESLHGPMNAEPLTDEQIRAHVGLYTNVSYEPRADWLDRTFRAAYPAAGVDRLAVPA
jgi:hypothetical protein